MQLYFEEYGKGDPVIFLHPGLETGQTSFQNQIEYFSRHFRVIVPDLRGQGHSYSEDFTDYLKVAALDVLELTEHLNLATFNIVGVSSGALIAVQMLQLNQQNISSCTLAGIMLEKPAEWEKLNKENAQRLQSLIREPNTIHYFNQLHMKNNWKALLEISFHSNWYPFEQIQQLEEIEIPTLLIVGAKAEFDTKYLFSHFNNSTFIEKAVVPKAGHLVHHDAPNLFNIIVEDFIQRSILEK
ncbi:alpha/beta hydrolase [Bacillus sp. JJ864]|uniref:alpha/beta fold hydrolase n=1 Tax=Bacillus sp. JJ864 TaxID=3122975 RepID=UPI002FFDE9BB